MRAVIQRVKSAQVVVEGQVVSRIGRGILTLLGVAQGDAEGNVDKIVDKILNLRIFPDEAGKMNLSVKDLKGEHLIVSQFTLLGDCSQGRRPSFVGAEKPDRAKALYELALDASRKLGVPTSGGVFQADMSVELVNDGPVTFVIDL